MGGCQGGPRNRKTGQIFTKNRKTDQKIGKNRKTALKIDKNRKKNIFLSTSVYCSFILTYGEILAIAF